MSDRFDHTLDRKIDPKADEADEATVVRRIELMTGAVRRRDWSDDDKVRIIVESLAPGANVSAIARRHGLRPQQLFTWRREARALFCDVLDESPERGARQPEPSQRAAERAPTQLPVFAPVLVASAAVASPAPPRPPNPPTASPPAGARQGIEIAIGAVIVRVGTHVDGEMLATVLAAVRRSS